MSRQLLLLDVVVAPAIAPRPLPTGRVIRSVRLRAAILHRRMLVGLKPRPRRPRLAVVAGVR